MDQPEKQEAAEQQRKPRGSASFAIPHAAINALIAAKADAYMIGTYLTLACFTEESGCFSTGSINAISKWLSVYKPKAQTVRDKLTEITARNKTTGELEPLVYTRKQWLEKQQGEMPPDPPGRYKIEHVLPDFGEELSERVWFGSGLVRGYGEFEKPLTEVKAAGDVAARLLLLMYQRHDMVTWGGLPPAGGAHARYVYKLDTTYKHYRIIHAESASQSCDTSFMTLAVAGATQRYVTEGTGRKKTSYWKAITLADAQELLFWDALNALKSSGIIYEVVMVTKGRGVEVKHADGATYLTLPSGAEPLYELDCLNLHGPKPKDEEGIGWATAKTTGDLGKPVTNAEGHFFGRYAAIVPHGYGAMIAGIYRLRFRPANPKNAGVRDAWARIREGNRQGLKWINACRKAAHLEPLGKPPHKAGEAASGGDDSGFDPPAGYVFSGSEALH